MSLKEELIMSRSELQETIEKTVMETLTQLGVDHKDPMGMQKDFQYLRKWRESSEAIHRKGVATLVGIFIISVAAALLLGAKEYFSN